MINLLPYDENKQTRAARTNLILVRFIVFLGLGIGFLVLACIATYFLIIVIRSQNEEINKLNSDVTSSISTTTDPASNFKSNLITAKNIIDQQVPYYKILSSLSSALPAGTVIDSISIDDNTINSVLNIKIYSTTSGFETKVKEGFQKSPIFSDYQLIGTESPQTDQPGYKFSINISIKVNKAALL